MFPALILSSDSHVFEPPDLWTTRIDKPFRHRAPRMVRIDGADQLVVEGTNAAAEEIPSSRISGWIAHLPQRQRFVLERRYGLNDQGVQTLAEIAEELGLTRERVRQIQSEALARLRLLVDAENARP